MSHPVITALPELMRLADRVMGVVQDVRNRTEQVAAGAEIQPAEESVLEAEGILADVLTETERLYIAERAAYNKLGYALDRVRKEENEARQTALTLDRRKRNDPAALAAMTRAQSRHREVEQLAAELAQAEANVEQAQDFLEAVRAHHEDVNRTVATLRRRFAGAERRAALTQLSGTVQQRMAGVAELTDRVETAEAKADAGLTAAGLDPERAGIIARGRLRRGEAAEELDRLRGEQ